MIDAGRRLPEVSPMLKTVIKMPGNAVLFISKSAASAAQSRSRISGSKPPLC
jgi:hypothetical protein